MGDYGQYPRGNKWAGYPQPGYGPPPPPKKGMPGWRIALNVVGGVFLVFFLCGALVAIGRSDSNGDPMEVLGPILMVLFLLFMYFLPSIVATSRHHHNAGMIFILNFFLGWSVLGWIIPLAMACGQVQPPPPRLR